MNTELLMVNINTRPGRVDVDYRPAQADINWYDPHDSGRIAAERAREKGIEGIGEIARRGNAWDGLKPDTPSPMRRSYLWRPGKLKWILATCGARK